MSPRVSLIAWTIFLFGGALALAGSTGASIPTTSQTMHLLGEPTAATSWGELILKTFAAFLGLCGLNAARIEWALLHARRAVEWVEEEDRAGRLAADIDKFRLAVTHLRSGSWPGWLTLPDMSERLIQQAVASNPAIGAKAKASLPPPRNIPPSNAPPSPSDPPKR